MTASVDGLPIGTEVDTAPAGRPDAFKLKGRFCVVEKLDLVRHAESLWQAVKGHDDLWAYMGYGPFADEASFLRWVEDRAMLLDPFAYAVVDQASGRAVGIVTLMEIRPAMGVIEMGNIVYTPLLQRTAAATEAQYLMARHVFDDLNYRRYEWKCNALNAPSRRAAERLGFTYEGTFRQHMIVKGRNRDTAWYAMTDGDWPAVKAAFEAWLRPENFDAAGQQRRGLASFRN
jgi:RimJ/RimL family protein N-acetyltransferase